MIAHLLRAILESLSPIAHAGREVADRLLPTLVQVGLQAAVQWWGQ